MSDTLKDPEPPDKDRAAGSQSTARTCPACGAAYFGPYHKGCPGSKPAPARPPGAAESSIDEIPAEAKPYETDASRQLNQYILVKQVGRGGMGAVWKAWDRNLTRWAAVKFLLAHEQNDILRFQREAKLAARLRHPNIAAIYEVGHAKSAQLGSDVTHYLAMEFIEGRSLHEATLSLREVAALFIKISAGIEAAHRGGVIHRDLKPQNIMLNAEGWPYVMDFGLAKALQGDSSLSVSGAVMGTPAYMPPEQAEGRLEDIDARSDVYSLGATLYAVLCRRPPFGGQNPLEILTRVTQQEPPTPSSLNKEIPPPLERIILKAMSKAPADRYASVSEFAKDLERYMANETVKAAAQGAYDPTVIARPVPPKKRSVMIPVMIGGIVVAILAAVVLLYGRGAAPSAPSPSVKSEPVVVKAPEPPPVKPDPKPEPKPEPKIDAVVTAPAPKPVEAPPPPPLPKPEPKPEPKIEAPPPPPPPPKVDEDEKSWKQTQAILAIDAWTPGDAEFPKRTHALLGRYLPKEASREAVVARWFGGEIEKARSSYRQRKGTPEQQQTEARRIAAWLDAVTGAVGGIGALQDVARSVDALRAEVETQIRGKFKLTIAPAPFAEVTRMTCDGRLLKLQKRETPLVLQGLEIGDYEIELENPDLGKRSVKIASKDLRDGRAYSVSGKMADPALKVTELPQ